MTTIPMPVRQQRVLSSGSTTAPTDREQLIRSRHHVKTYGEVLTPRDMVEKMLDVIVPAGEVGIDYIDMTFFEPAAGNGNFLVAILERKLQAVESSYRSRKRRRMESLFALSSIYAVELQDDNHTDAQEALRGKLAEYLFKWGIGFGPRTNLRKAADCLIRANILQGDTLKAWEGSAELTFSWWIRELSDLDIVRPESFTLKSLRPGYVRQLSIDSGQVPPPTFPPCRIDHVHKKVRVDG